MRPHPDLRAALALVAVACVVGVTVFLAVRDTGGGSTATGPATWQGLVGDAHPAVQTAQRQIVVLKTPSVAQRLAAAHYATEDDERRWAAQAYAVQQQVLTLLSARGLGVRPDYTFARVLNGFSAILDARAIAVLQSVPEVAGVYPVRAAFPAAVSAQALAQAQAFAPAVQLPGFDGRGLTIALLDTGVDRTQPYLRGRVDPGLDIVDETAAADARPSPQAPSQVERHGTQMAGLLVGAGGPGGLHGVAPAATVFPIRVAAWQPDAEGRSVVYARTDQLIAGLDRAVDPDGDGDAHDAARIALVGVAAPFASFADSPESQAVAGALALDMLVVAPAGNEGAAGPLFGSLAGPSGSEAALTVGATDDRPTTTAIHVVLRRGLDVVLDARLPLLGSGSGSGPQELSLGVPRGTGATAVDYFDRRGLSLVAGRAAFVEAGEDPGAAAVAAAHSGALAVFLYGKTLPSGSLGLSSELGIPVVALPAAPARALLRARKQGYEVAVALGQTTTSPNSRASRLAPFSSRGLSFGGLVKPDLTAPGTALATSDPGVSADGEPAFASVSGTSAAAASVAGAAALLAQARPGLGALDLRSLLVGYAGGAGAPTAGSGAGGVDVGASAAAELVASTASVSFGAWQGNDWRATRRFTIRNVSSRRLIVHVDAVPARGSESQHVVAKPSRILLRVGRSARITVTIRATRPRVDLALTGAVTLTPAGSQTLRVPWAVAFPRARQTLLPRARIQPTQFRPSDAEPAILRVRAGRLADSDGLQILPVSRLDVLLYDANGRFIGLLARLRDLLPGSYSFGITGRGPTGAPLARGDYELRLVAWPVLEGEPSRNRVRFTIG